MCDLRATFLADLVRKLFFDIIFFLGVCGSQGLYNSSSVWEMRIQKRSSGHLRGAMLSDELLHPRVAQSVFARNFPSDTVTEGWQDRCDNVYFWGDSVFSFGKIRFTIVHEIIITQIIRRGVIHVLVFVTWQQK